MNILHTESSPNFGGQELRTIKEIIHLKKFGINSILVCKKGSAIEEIAKRHKIKYFTTSFYSSLDINSIRAIYKIIKDYNINIVNSHSGYDAWCSVLPCIIRGIPFIRSRHIGLPLKKNIQTRIIYGKLAKKIIVTSNFIKNEIAKVIERIDHIHVIPTGIEVEKFSSVSRIDFYSKFNIPKSHVILGFISVLKSDKGPHILLKSLSQVLKHKSNISLIIAGSGNFERKCHELVNELGLRGHVHFLGHVNNVEEVFNSIDIFVLPAIRPEGVPQSVLQAFAAKKPVIASNIGGINEVAIHDYTAYLVEPRNLNDLSKAILFMIENKDYKNSLIKNAYELLIKNYTLDAMLNKLYATYTEVVND